MSCFDVAEDTVTVGGSQRPEAPTILQLVGARQEAMPLP